MDQNQTPEPSPDMSTFELDLDKQRMLEEGLITVDGDDIVLTDKGRAWLRENG